MDVVERGREEEERVGIAIAMVFYKNEGESNM